MNTYGFDVFISTGLVAAWRIQNPYKEENEEVEVSYRQLRKLHKLWGIFLSRRTYAERQPLCHLQFSCFFFFLKDRAETKRKPTHVLLVSAFI